MSVTEIKTPKKNKIRTGSLIFDIFLYVLMALLSIIFIYPLYQVLVCSISDPGIVATKNSLMLWPEGIHFDAYRVVFQNKNILIGFRNTFMYLVIGTSITYLMTVMMAYPLSIKNLYFKRPILFYFTFTMYFGGGLIPYFLLINNLGLMNTIWAIVLPGISVYDMIILRTNFVNLPDELKEAAYIDGANDLHILVRIMIPLSTAVTAVLVLFSAVGFWNMWFPPMIYLTRRELYPLQSVLREILIDNASVAQAGRAGVATKLDRNTDKQAVGTLIKYANILVSTVPILVVYPFAQKYFVKGVMVGSLKG